MASNIKHLMTVADLDAFPDDDGKRYELIEGELFVSCAPGLPHQLVLAKLITVFTVYLERNPIGIAAPGPGAVFSNYDAVIPDLVFARTERLDSIVGKRSFCCSAGTGSRNRLPRQRGPCERSQS